MRVWKYFFAIHTFEPLFGCLRVAQDHSILKMAVSTLMKVTLLRHMAVIVGPAPDHRVELGYQIDRGGLLVRLHDFPDVPQECFDLLSGWFDKEFTSVLPDVLSQKIEAVLDVGNVGFLRGEFQSAFAEKVFHQAV